MVSREFRFVLVQWFLRAFLGCSRTIQTRMNEAMIRKCVLVQFDSNIQQAAKALTVLLVAHHLRWKPQWHEQTQGLEDADLSTHLTGGLRLRVCSPPNCACWVLRFKNFRIFLETSY